MSLGDKFDAKKDQVVGDAKERIGDATDNERLQGEGASQHAGGELKEGWENIKDKTNEVIGHLKEKFDGDHERDRH